MRRRLGAAWRSSGSARDPRSAWETGRGDLRRSRVRRAGDRRRGAVLRPLETEEDPAAGPPHRSLHDDRAALPDADFPDPGGQLEWLVHVDAAGVLSGPRVVAEELLQQRLRNGHAG